MGRRTQDWWITRFELVLGMVLTLIAGWLALSAAREGCFGCFIAGWPLPIQPGWLVALIAIPVPLIGLAWMIRILRGPGDDPPAWRYRDR